MQPLRLVLLVAVAGWTLNSIHDVRYTLGPEVFRAGERTASGGLWSHFKGDATFRANAKAGLGETAEMGGWLSVPTWDTFGDAQAFAGIGGKYRLTSYEALTLDLQAGLNNTDGFALVAGYVRSHHPNRRMGMLYETRVGVFDGVVPEGGWVAWEFSTTPTLSIGKAAVLMVGVPMSSTLAHVRRDFHLDLVPGGTLYLRDGWFVQPEFAVSIVGPDVWRLGIHAGRPF